LDFCPVCSLACDCSRCNRRLDAVSFDFKAYCKAQGTKPQDTFFDDILIRCAVSVKPSGYRGGTTPSRRKSDTNDPENTSVTTGKAGKKRSLGAVRESYSKSRRLVPKPPLTDFPREVRGMREFEPGSATDYLTVFSSDGNYLCEDIDIIPQAKSEQEKSTDDGKNSPVPSNEEVVEEVVEDGNVDFCHACKRHGNLLCCDFCPRAFHPTCMEGTEKDSKSSGRWECHVCRKENQGMDDDKVTGEKSLDLIGAAFLNAEVDNNGALESIRVLSMIHEMVEKLMDYDFGYMFRESVDVEQVAGYKEIVKKPMDLGTIGSKLINGGYSDHLKSRQSWDDVVVAVLKDIELVWHNCFTFNYEGSAIYRMADVHRRRMLSIRSRSFDDLLSLFVKGETDEYVKLCEKDRGKFAPTPLVLNGAGSSTDQSIWASRPKGKHKITVKMQKGGVTRPIAVLDPHTGRLAKVYSTVKSGAQAAMLLAGLGHKCEWTTITDQSFKSIVNRGSSDPSMLIFGYRWLTLEDLRSGAVVFPEVTSEIIEMKQNEKYSVFMSIDEALSDPDLPKVSLGQLRKDLLGLKLGDDWVTIAARSWRRPKPLNKGIPLGYQSSSSHVFPHDDLYFSKHSVLSKEDLMTGRRLIGFENVDVAFQDWVVTCESSPAFPLSEERNQENFYAFYLDGDRNVDGIVWRTLPVDKPVETNKPAEITESRTTESMEVENIEVPKTTDQIPIAPPVVEGNAEAVSDEKKAEFITEGGAMGNNAEELAVEVNAEDVAVESKAEETMLDESDKKMSENEPESIPVVPMASGLNGLNASFDNGNDEQSNSLAKRKRVHVDDNLNADNSVKKLQTSDTDNTFGSLELEPDLQNAKTGTLVSEEVRHETETTA
jgi:hypothetical protein